MQVMHMAPQGASRRAVPGDRLGRRRRRPARLPIQTCWPDDAGPLITWGLTVTRGPHKKRQNLGIYRQQVIGAQQAHHALAGAPRRRARLSRSSPGASGHAVSGRRRARRRSGDDARRGDAGAGHAVANTSSPACCAARRPRSSSASAHDLQVPARPRSCSKASSIPMRRPPATNAPRAVRRPHRLLQRESSASRCSRIERITMRRDPDLSLDLHRQAAGRAGGARRGAERSVRAAAAEAVSRDRRLLSAARRLLVSPRRASA